jgi:hypothetical protein
MLTTLRKFDQSARSEILASYAKEYLPNPGIGDAPSKLPDDLKQKIKEEIARALRLPQNSPEPKQLILDFLVREMQATLIDAKKVKKIRDRVAQKGALDGPQYELEFSEFFRNQVENLGLGRNTVAAAFSARDSVIEHFLPDDSIEGDEKFTATLLTRVYGGHDPYTLIVWAARDKAKLRVDQAWVAYHSEVDMSAVSDPVGALSSFADVYGCDIQVGNTRGKFILYEKIRLKPNQNSYNALELLQPDCKEQDASFVHRISGGGVVEVAFAFSLNVRKYVVDLTRHGRKISRKLDAP